MHPYGMPWLGLAVLASCAGSAAGARPEASLSIEAAGQLTRPPRLTRPAGPHEPRKAHIGAAERDLGVGSESNESPANPGSRGHGFSFTEGAELLNDTSALQCGGDTCAVRDLDSPCPAACPLVAENRKQPREGYCYFRCVAQDMCGAAPSDELAVVPDWKAKICRRCRSPGCDHCIGHNDTCLTCMPGYRKTEQGQCETLGENSWWGIAIGLGIVMLLVSLYLFDLMLLRPTVNQKGLAQGDAFRRRLMLFAPREPGADGAETEAVEPSSPHLPGSGSRHLYPLGTDLFSRPVAGPGTALHFNFQAAMLLWSSVIVISWLIFGHVANPELFMLGLRPATTPLQFCRVIRWGHKTQLDWIWVKVVFTLACYLGSFSGALAFGVYQLRLYNKLDDQTTMRDFAAFCQGLPPMSGAEQVEDKLRDAVAAATGQPVVGVSPCWHFEHQHHKVHLALEHDMERSEEANDRRASLQAWLGGLQDEAEVAAPGCCRWLLMKVDMLLASGFGVDLREESAGEEAPELKDLRELLLCMKTTDTAVVVFETEAARDTAVAQSGLHVGGRAVRLSKKNCEPDTLLWENFGKTTAQVVTRLAIGVLGIALYMAVWMGVIYLPYAYYMASFSYASGEEPSEISEALFTALVVGGNLGMFVVSDWVAEYVGFTTTDLRGATYVLLYTISCFCNMIADLTITSVLSYKQMTGMNVHNFDGRDLWELKYQELFESYPIQKALGKQVYAYAWPGCFLVPFLLEPVFMVFLPHVVSKSLVGSRRGVTGRRAEELLKFFALYDLARYADILLNCMLAVIVFFFPPGYLLPMFVGLVVSQVFIFFYDKYRVLRCVPSFCFAGNLIDQIAQGIMALPCAALLGCCVFKGNQLINRWTGFKPLNGVALAVVVAGAMVLHVIVHWWLIYFRLPHWIHEDHEPSMVPYADAAKRCPCTWFSANPVHCLRSRHIHQHVPASAFYVRGREYLLRANPKIGAYYEDRSYKVDD